MGVVRCHCFALLAGDVNGISGWYYTNERAGWDEMGGKWEEGKHTKFRKMYRNEEKFVLVDDVEILFYEVLLYTTILHFDPSPVRHSPQTSSEIQITISCNTFVLILTSLMSGRSSWYYEKEIVLDFVAVTVTVTVIIRIRTLPPPPPPSQPNSWRCFGSGIDRKMPHENFPGKTE